MIYRLTNSSPIGALVNQTTLSQRVYDELHERLRQGALRPGTRLVNRTLAHELGTSTIPVREAIGRLVSEGLLEFTPGAGAFVRSPEPNELGELYDVREALELLAVAEAVRFAKDDLAMELRSLCDRFGQLVADIPAGEHATREQFSLWLECDERFHTRLVAASRNRWLVRVIHEVRVIAQVFAAQRRTPEMLTREAAEDTWQQHMTFIDILERKDVEQARQWMAAHIRSGRAMVLKYFSDHVMANVDRQLE